MAGPEADELVDFDPLSGFAEESGENHAEIALPLSSDEQQRLDRIERTIDTTQQELAQIRAEIATLVGTIADIKKRRPAAEMASQPGRSWTGAATATVGVLLGIAIGVLVWMQLAGAKPVPVGAAPQQQEPAALPADQPASPEPVTAVPVVSTPAAPTRDQQSPSKRPPVDHAQPVNYVGGLSIDADPDGEVFINRQDAGRTPLRLDKLRAGSHLIWIERDGYQRWTRVVQVQADRVTRLSAELEPTVSR